MPFVYLTVNPCVMLVLPHVENQLLYNGNLCPAQIVQMTKLRVILFTELAPRSTQSISCNVSLLVVPSSGDRDRMDWRFLVQECVTKIAEYKKSLFGEGFNTILGFSKEDKYLFGKPAYCAQPRSQQGKSLWLLHTLRDSMSPVSGIFF